MLLQSESMAVCVWPLADSLFATKFLSLVPQWEEYSPRGWPTCAPSPLGASVSQSVQWRDWQGESECSAPLCHFMLLWIARLPWWLSKRICLQRRRPRFDFWVRKILWRREWLPTPVFLPRNSHGQRSRAGYSPWGCKELTWLSN